MSQQKPKIVSLFISVYKLHLIFHDLRPLMRRQWPKWSAYRSSTQRLHCDHILGTGERQLDDLEQRLADAGQRRDAGAERQQENVQPGDEERQPPGKQQQEEPDDGPQQARTQATLAAAGTFTHDTAASGGICCLNVAVDLL